MPEENSKELNQEESFIQEVSFHDIKEVASKNISQLLNDLQDFELAIENENIPEIYRIYNGRLHQELKKTSNKNHEIDELLARKIHDNFVSRFSFMVPMEKVSPTIQYYKIGTYYHERATIGIDASIPEIFVIPKIDEEWQFYKRGKEEVLNEITKEIDALDAKEISAKTEIQKLDSQIKKIKQEENELIESKGFFNRGKIDEEIEEITRKRKGLEAKRQEWLRFTEDSDKIKEEKEVLSYKYRQFRLNRAIAEKEFRLIDRYFGSLSSLSVQLQEFLANYLEKEEMRNDE